MWWCYCYHWRLGDILLLLVEPWCFWMARIHIKCLVALEQTKAWKMLQMRRMQWNGRKNQNCLGRQELDLCVTAMWAKSAEFEELQTSCSLPVMLLLDWWHLTHVLDSRRSTISQCSFPLSIWIWIIRIIYTCDIYDISAQTCFQ